MPRAADVWSLGIVLINMCVINAFSVNVSPPIDALLTFRCLFVLNDRLYHYNPWTDTTEGACPSFSLFRQNPTHFFLSRFSGMTPGHPNKVMLHPVQPDECKPRPSVKKR